MEFGPRPAFDPEDAAFDGVFSVPLSAKPTRKYPEVGDGRDWAPGDAP